MADTPPRKRSNILSIITLIIILLTFGYYYFYYVPYNKSQFTEQAFRMINRVSKNVEARAINYQKIIDNSVKKFNLRTIHISTSKIDLNKKLDDVRFPKELELSSISFKEKYSSVNNFVKTSQGIKIGTDKLKFTYSIEKDDRDLQASFYCKSSQFFPITLRYDFFNKYIIFTDSAIVYSDMPVTSKVISDSLIFDGPLQSSQQITVVIDQMKHQLYLVPLNLDGTTLYIGGLTDQQYFDTLTHSLSPFTYTIIAFLIILLVVAMPYFKLYFITEKERLNTMDAIFSFVVLLIGSAFLVVMLIFFLQQQGPERELRINFLKNIAEKLEDNFQKEVGDIIDQIQFNEDILMDNIDEDKYGDWVHDRRMYASDTAMFKLYPNYKAITWINDTAEQIAKWNARRITTRVNVANREYYSEVRKGNLYFDKEISSQPFFIQSLYSITTGHLYAFISKKSTVKGPLKLDPSKVSIKGDSALYPKVVMVATQLESLSNQKLPENVSYMVIDASGNVLFHRNTKKQKQENLLEETNNNHVLADCLHGHTEGHFVNNYDTHQKLFFVKPLGQLPLYMVTYLDYEYERLVDVQILGLTAALFLGLFFLFVFVVALFVYADYEVVKKIKSYNLFFKWFWPNKKKGTLYSLLSVFIILAVVLFIFGDFYHSVYMSYSFFMLLMVTVILCLRQFKNWHEIYTHPAYIIYFVIVYGAGLTGFYYSLKEEDFGLGWGVPFLVLIIGTIYYSYRGSKKQRNFTFKRYQYKYHIFVFIVVVAIGILPALSFFKWSFDYEKRLYVKNIQLNLARQYKKIPVNKWFLPYQESTIKSDSFLYLQAELPDGLPIEEDGEKKWSPLSAFMDSFRLGSTSTFFTSHHLNEVSNSTDRPFFWSNSNDRVKLYLNGAPALKITSGDLKLNYYYLFKNELTPWQLFFGFAFLLIIILMAIFQLVVYWSRRIFLLGLLPSMAFDLKESLTQLKQHSLIISASFSEGIIYLKKHCENKKHLWIDLTNPPPNITPDNAVWVIEKNKVETIVFADYKPFDKDIISLKIKWIKTVLAINSDSPGERVRILVVTPYLPVHMDSFDDEDQQYMVQKYLEVVSGFKKSYFPIGYENELLLEKSSSKKKLDKMLKQEALVLPSYELESYHGFLNAQRKKAGMDENDVILYVQSNEQMLYHSLWNNCTQQEQYLIYDLAEDGLLNSKNLPDIYNLLLKGIMVEKNGRLKLFNHSFQNFVLSVISPQQALEIEHEAKMEGGWANSQLPIIMIIFGLLLFLFVSQQNVFNYLIGWVTAALGSIPLLTRAFAGFGGLKFLNFSSKK